MNKYLNPIYGLILCYNGYVTNNFYLHKHGYVNDEISKFIRKISKYERIDLIKPTNDIMELKPIDLGRYIGIKFINMNHNLILDVSKKKIIYIQTINQDKAVRKQLDEYISKLRRFIPIDDHNEPIFFYLLLYCMWWVADNDQGIIEYYTGINQVFALLNKYISSDYQYEPVSFDTQTNSDTDDTFESIVYNITKEPFIVFGQEWSKDFCNPGNKYPDCGEVTARNLINLLCFNNDKFDIQILNKFNPIPQLIEYYTQFNDFSKQSDKKLYCIYQDKLDARDAWSKLIINYANNNLVFVKSCKNHGYELNSGLSSDKKNSNFFQLIKNLLPGITNWDDLKTNIITDIVDKTTGGVGVINITHKEYGNITIHLQAGHYYMEEIKPVNKSINYDYLTPNQQDQIKILLKQKSFLSIDNYLWFKFDSNLLVDLLNDSNTNIELRIKLFELSLTSRYDSDARRRINLDVDDLYFFNIIICKYRDNVNINEYTFLSNDFTFIKKIPNLFNLNSVIKNKNLTTIDLSPLSKLKSIGNGFMSGCSSLTSIDLSPLSNIQSIGNNFMYNCRSLTEINLSGLSNLQSIRNNFMYGCSGLTSIDLSLLSNLQSIGDYFMNDCSNLTSIDLSSLSNLQSIGDKFINKCSRLTSIDLSPLSNIQSIGNNFMNECSNLTSIDLSPLSNIQSIGNYFMFNCLNLTSIDLSGLSNLQSTGSDFMLYCLSLTSIDLSGLSNLQSIGKNFMAKCSSLTSIDLSSLSNLQSIGDNFMYACSSLTSIDLSSLSNLQSIGDYFMNKCSRLTSIDLSELSNLQSIGDYFMNKCSRLKIIKCTEKQRILMTTTELYREMFKIV
jgi:hypothetical protein